jgi:hypothetical protein
MNKLISLIALFCVGFLPVPKDQLLMGAWENTQGDMKTTRIYTGEIFSVATYNVKEKKFEGTYGGKYVVDGNTLVETIEFDTWQPASVGTQTKTKWALKKGDLMLTHEKGETHYSSTDKGGPGKLAGAWLITGRFDSGEMRKMTPGARRTMKILSGTRFQWIAYNVDTKEFFGTGGGTYTTVDGKYAETIEFFSRDATRVGMSLGFDFSLMEDGGWRHSGKSSKGEPIDEIWTQREKLGI